MAEKDAKYSGGWAPRGLARLAPNAPLATTRRWVAIAEEAAPRAVELFQKIMDNPKYPMKIRMEAATRICQIAGLTLRGEKRDGQGRPAVQSPIKSGQPTKLNQHALRTALAMLPDDVIRYSPSEVGPDERVVVLQDSDQVKNAGFGKIPDSPIGAVFERGTESDSADEG